MCTCMVRMHIIIIIIIIMFVFILYFFVSFILPSHMRFVYNYTMFCYLLVNVFFQMNFDINFVIE